MSDTNTIVDKAQIRNLIERKKAQIVNFEKDKLLDDKNKSFTDKQYDEKIKDLESDITGLEGSLDD